jgi:hypothetical protein
MVSIFLADIVLGGYGSRSNQKVQHKKRERFWPGHNVGEQSRTDRRAQESIVQDELSYSYGGSSYSYTAGGSYGNSGSFSSQSSSYRIDRGGYSNYTIPPPTNSTEVDDFEVASTSSMFEVTATNHIFNPSVNNISLLSPLYKCPF